MNGYTSWNWSRTLYRCLTHCQIGCEGTFHIGITQICRRLPWLADCSLGILSANLMNEMPIGFVFLQTSDSQ
jgi:hypothetical protein